MAFLIVGCNENAVEPKQQLCEAARAIRGTPQFLSVAEEADIAARVLPGGFGGLYQEFGGSSDGILVAYFKDSAPSTERKTDLRNVLLCGAVYPGWAGRMVTTDLQAIGIRQGQYTGAELLSYLRALEPLRSDSAVWALEVDPETNRVWIGLTEGAELTRIQQAVSARSVPTAAVTIEVPPPTTGSEQFEVLDAPVTAEEAPDEVGVFGFWLRVSFTNHQTSVRYPDWCVNLSIERFLAYFAYTLQKWDGTQWKTIHGPICVSVLLPPRSIAPGQTATDSVPVPGVRRLNAEPRWRTARITGAYRFVGKVYMSTTSDGSGPIFLSDPAPAEEQVSAPFRLINTTPF